ncbi:endonuclease/exonuclease/phosphatase family protein [Zhouia sp. PK063]|uniref:endonuclease/exonuclease/phosphatase family protein n=1 Tax=Zhouia sp. PK063 TaxID=3373602 RepID=UPI0037A028C0
MSILPFKQWWVRFFDFPRLQLVVIHVFVLILFILLEDFSTLHLSILVVLVISLSWQAAKIYPYTSLAKKEVQNSSNTNHVISMMSANILQDNKQVNKFLNILYACSPDLVIVLEANDWWENELRSIEVDYPNTVKEPLSNYYGIILYSKLPLKDMKISYLIDKNIPSIHGKVQLHNTWINLHCIHPMPPSPTENAESTDRDGELLYVAKNIIDKNKPSIVMGDLNDVAWSSTTTIFQKISQLLDPRKGRGFFNTFNAKIPLIKWPLDHLFISSEFRIIELKRPGKTGSDHYPMYAKLSFEPIKKDEQHTFETATVEDIEQAEEDINKAKEAHQNE